MCENKDNDRPEHTTIAFKYIIVGKLNKMLKKREPGNEKRETKSERQVHLMDLLPNYIVKFAFPLFFLNSPAWLLARSLVYSLALALSFAHLRSLTISLLFWFCWSPPSSMDLLFKECLHNRTYVLDKALPFMYGNAENTTHTHTTHFLREKDEIRETDREFTRAREIE